MKVEMYFDCSICGVGTPMKFAKPSIIGQATCAVTCKGCNSKFSVVIKAKRGSGPRSATYTAHPEFISNKAKAIYLKNQADLKARALELK